MNIFIYIFYFILLLCACILDRLTKTEKETNYDNNLREKSNTERGTRGSDYGMRDNNDKIG